MDIVHNEFLRDLLAFVANKDIHDEIWWRRDLRFFAKCSDLFFWGFADVEELTPERLPFFKECIASVDEIDAETGVKLYCARIRQMRPQGACYTCIDRKYWALFDSCGPEREVGHGNPYAPGEYRCE